jgi:hypothetical protein
MASLAGNTFKSERFAARLAHESLDPTSKGSGGLRFADTAIALRKKHGQASAGRTETGDNGCNALISGAGPIATHHRCGTTENYQQEFHDRSLIDLSTLRALRNPSRRAPEFPTGSALAILGPGIFLTTCLCDALAFMNQRFPVKWLRLGEISNPFQQSKLKNCV